MNEKSITTVYRYYQDISQITSRDQQLLIAAREALQGAYAPYSHFKVGCALLLEDGTIVKGSNQENGAYPSGLCAERVAFFWVGANHPDKRIIAVAITASSDQISTDHPITPCGACRQSMLEYELNQTEPIQLIMQGSSGGIILVESVKSLLPLFFSEQGLKH